MALKAKIGWSPKGALVLSVSRTNFAAHTSSGLFLCGGNDLDSLSRWGRKEGEKSQSERRIMPRAGNYGVASTYEMSGGTGERTGEREKTLRACLAAVGDSP